MEGTELSDKLHQRERLAQSVVEKVSELAEALRGLCTEFDLDKSVLTSDVRTRMRQCFGEVVADLSGGETSDVRRLSLLRLREEADGDYY